METRVQDSIWKEIGQSEMYGEWGTNGQKEKVGRDTWNRQELVEREEGGGKITVKYIWICKTSGRGKTRGRYRKVAMDRGIGKGQNTLNK